MSGLLPGPLSGSEPQRDFWPQLDHKDVGRPQATRIELQVYHNVNDKSTYVEDASDYSCYCVHVLKGFVVPSQVLS